MLKLIQCSCGTTKWFDDETNSDCGHICENLLPTGKEIEDKAEAFRNHRFFLEYDDPSLAAKDGFIAGAQAMKQKVLKKVK